MDKKVKQKFSKDESSQTIIRISLETKKKLSALVAKANDKLLGRKIKADQMISMALDFVTEEKISKLQKESLSSVDRQKLIWKFYCDKVQKISEEKFTELLITGEYFEFYQKYKNEIDSI